jgi:hypothetical protein
MSTLSLKNTPVMKDRTLRVNVTVDISSDAKMLHATVKRELYQDGVLVREKTFTDDIARDFQ